MMNPNNLDSLDPAEENSLYAQHADIKDWSDLVKQRGTPIPAIFNQFYKFIQNPSTVSVDTFKRMIDTDDTIGSGIDFLTSCLVARIGRYEHPNKEIEQWMNKALDKIKGGFSSVCKEMLSATWAGFSVSEKVWANEGEFGFVIKKLVPLPPSTIMFETERSGELTNDGILQYQAGLNPGQYSFGSGLFGFSNGSQTRTYQNDPMAKFGDYPFPLRTGNLATYQTIRIPVGKCVHFSMNGQGSFGNPYGRSVLRRAYKWYVMKDAFLQMLAVALDRKGTPLTVVFADSTAQIRDTRAANAAGGGNMRGKNVTVRPDEAAAEAFANVHNDSMIVLPGKKSQIYDIETISQQSNASDFIESIQLCDRGILRAMLIPSLIFTNGDGTGSYALGQEHAKTFDKILDSNIDPLVDCILNQIVKHLLAFNFPVSTWADEGLGSFARSELSIDEIAREIDVFEKAINMGIVDPTDLKDLNAMRDKIRMPPRTEPIQEPLQLDPNNPGGLPQGMNGDEEDGDGSDGEDDENSEQLFAKIKRYFRLRRERRQKIQSKTAA